MSLNSTIPSLEHHVKSAYDSLETKGVKLPPNKNVANLSPTIDAINLDKYIVPEFDGGKYGAIAYIDANGDVSYYAAESDSDLKTVLTANSSSVAPTSIIKQVSNNYVVKRIDVLAFSIGSSGGPVPSDNDFLNSLYNLRRIYGLDGWSGKIGSSFLVNCPSFNQEIIIPETINSIGSSFMGACLSINRIVIPSSVTSITAPFMTNIRNLKEIVVDAPPPSGSIGNSLATIVQNTEYESFITVSGNSAVEWKNKIPDINNSSSGTYYHRKLILG